MDYRLDTFYYYLALPKISFIYTGRPLHDGSPWHEHDVPNQSEASLQRDVRAANGHVFLQIDKDNDFKTVSDVSE